MDLRTLRKEQLCEVAELKANQEALLESVRWLSRVKSLVANPDNLNLIVGTHMRQGTRTRSFKLASDLMCTVARSCTQ